MRRSAAFLVSGAVAVVAGCAHPHERELARLVRDARTPSAFAAHFAPDVPAASIDVWRAALAAEDEPSGYELVENRGCNRITWGDWVIDHSYYVFFTAEPRKVRSIERDSGFGEAMAGFGAIETRKVEHPTLAERCAAAK